MTHTHTEDECTHAAVHARDRRRFGEADDTWEPKNFAEPAVLTTNPFGLSPLTWRFIALRHRAGAVVAPAQVVDAYGALLAERAAAALVAAETSLASSLSRVASSRPMPPPQASGRVENNHSQRGAHAPLSSAPQ